MTSSISQLETVVLAVYLLEGESRSVDTEDVAVKCRELAPGMFSWQKYPNQINLELVRVTLSAAKNPKNGGLLVGSGRQGWRLSQAGLDWLSTTGKKLLSQKQFIFDQSRLNAGSIDAVRKMRESARLQASVAWKNWLEQRPITPRDAFAIFRIDEYATPKMLENKIVRLRGFFDDDPELGPFVKQLANMVLELRRHQ